MFLNPEISWMNKLHPCVYNVSLYMELLSPDPTPASHSWVMFICEPNHQWACNRTRWQRKNLGKQSSSHQASLREPDKSGTPILQEGVKGEDFAMVLSCLKSTCFNLVQKRTSHTSTDCRLSAHGEISLKGFIKKRKSQNWRGMCQNGSSRSRLAAINIAELHWGPGSWISICLGLQKIKHQF